MKIREIPKGKVGGWRPNSGRKAGFVGYWKGKKRPNAVWQHLVKYHVRGKENYFSKNILKGKDHPNWKDNDVGYLALHDWVARELSRPDKCSNCQKICKPDWANKSHKYLRDLSDWIALCKKCHYHYDRKGILI